jgi:hypothetical protein
MRNGFSLSANLSQMAARKGSFNEGFSIDISLEQARQKFVNRAHNRIFEQFYNGLLAEHYCEQVYRTVGHHLGKVPDFGYSFSYQIGNNFGDVLQAIEAIYEVVSTVRRDLVGEFNGFVKLVLESSEVDLGIRWRPPHFYPAGAEELDQALVNENLQWLRKAGYESVVKPFEKGLRHLMESHKHPELRADVITDMYEALEAVAKKATGKDLDLAKNNDFIDTVKASNEYKKMLANYIGYANRFRHAVKETTPRPALSERETESFVYLTGVFIRLAMPK